MAARTSWVAIGAAAHRGTFNTTSGISVLVSVPGELTFPPLVLVVEHLPSTSQAQGSMPPVLTVRKVDGESLPKNTDAHRGFILLGPVLVT